MAKGLFAVSVLLLFVGGCATLQNLVGTSDTEVSQQAEVQAAPSAAAEKKAPATPSKSQAPASVTSEPAKGTSPNINPTNGQIRLVQIRLKAAGFDPGRVDGIMGPRTKAALQKYQAARGLTNSGALDEKTLKSLGVE
ncbi:MAG: peptidoglycan-binding domain-containing protein [Candidatus Binatia bacterium]